MINPGKNVQRLDPQKLKGQDKEAYDRLAQEKLAAEENLKDVKNKPASGTPGAQQARINYYQRKVNDVVDEINNFLAEESAEKYFHNYMNTRSAESNALKKNTKYGPGGLPPLENYNNAKFEDNLNNEIEKLTEEQIDNYYKKDITDGLSNEQRAYLYFKDQSEAYAEVMGDASAPESPDLPDARLWEQGYGIDELDYPGMEGFDDTKYEDKNDFVEQRYSNKNLPNVNEQELSRLAKSIGVENVDKLKAFGGIGLKVLGYLDEEILLTKPLELASRGLKAAGYSKAAAGAVTGAAGIAAYETYWMLANIGMAAYAQLQGEMRENNPELQNLIGNAMMSSATGVTSNQPIDVDKNKKSVSFNNAAQLEKDMRRWARGSLGVQAYQATIGKVTNTEDIVSMAMKGIRPMLGANE